MIKTFKFRLFTNANQERELSICLETHRRLYNAALDGVSLCWETAGANWSYGEQSAWFKTQRKSNEFFNRLNFGSAQQTLRTLDRAFKSFFSRIKKGQKPGYPRFKSKDRFNSFRYAMTGHGGGIKIVDRKLRLQGIGTIRIRWHREIPDNAKFKQASIIRENGKWFVAFAVELPESGKKCGTGSVGIDVGLNSFVTTSDGDSLGSSRTLENNLSELRRRQRALSRCKRGSNTRQKVKKRVTTLHAKVRNARKDMQHKVARSLVDRYECIAAESLDVKGMSRNSRLARRIGDAAWSQFVTILEHKAEDAGGQVIKVDPKNTSQMCSGCGEIVRKSLAVRVHRCDCGLVLDRDVNAAVNILGRAAPRFVNSEVVLN